MTGMCQESRMARDKEPQAARQTAQEIKGHLLSRPEISPGRSGHIIPDSCRRHGSVNSCEKKEGIQIDKSDNR